MKHPEWYSGAAVALDEHVKRDEDKEFEPIMRTMLTEDIYWVGYVDWTVRDFHGYRTERGSTYNAYLVMDEKTALIDSVKAPYLEVLLDHVREHVSLDAVDYLICNHAEPDHSGSLPGLVKACPNAAVICNAKCRAALGEHYDTEGWTFQVIGDTQTLSLGRRTLQFYDTPMVHWPESMATYVVEEALLFSMDGFGQHYASSHRFDDEEPMDVVMAEAKTYYANIVMPYGRQTAAALERLGGLDLKIVAPSHGIIWRSHFDRILAAYQEWVVCKPARKVVVIFATMWDSTRQMAQAMVDGASMDDVEVRLIDVNQTHDTQTVTEVIDAAALGIGSATLNMSIMPKLASALTYMRGLRPVGKAAIAFGSYGWAARGVKEVEAYLDDMKAQRLMESVTSKYRPTPEVLEQCREAGRQLALHAIEVTS